MILFFAGLIVGGLFAALAIGALWRISDDAGRARLNIAREDADWRLSRLRRQWVENDELRAENHRLRALAYEQREPWQSDDQTWRGE